VLDQYVDGTIDEKKLARELRWKKRWGVDFELYAPVFRAARAHRLRVVGLNAPRAVVRRVARVGLHNLSGQDRDKLPRPIDLGMRMHRRFFSVMIGGAHHHGLRGRKLDRYYAAQCVWDATMAEAALRWARAPGKARSTVVVIAGGGHVYYDLGIALRIAHRKPDVKLASVALVSVAHKIGRDVSRSLATYVIGTAPAPARASPHGKRRPHKKRGSHGKRPPHKKR
jgi:uncharacterized iron-regulated protein